MIVSLCDDSILETVKVDIKKICFSSFDELNISLEELKALKDLSSGKDINSPKKFKPVFYKRYVDDTFLLFKRPEHIKCFVDYINSKHKNINFSFEMEKDRQMPFFDVNMFCENGKFVTYVYKEETNFSSFIPLEYKFGLVYMLLHHCFCLVSDMSQFHIEIDLMDIPANSLINAF